MVARPSEMDGSASSVASAVLTLSSAQFDTGACRKAPCMKRIIFTLRAIYLLIFGAFIFLLVLFFLRRSSVEAIKTVEVAPTVRVSRAVGVRFPSVDFDSEAYYRPILEYNLFRPLGWTPPHPVEPYRLLGTLLPIDKARSRKRSLNQRKPERKPISFLWVIR